MIYLDHNATTPVAKEVVEAMRPYWGDVFGNPSSSHPFGRKAREALEEARSQVADLLGCLSREVVFTSGGTESNNTVIKCVAYSLKDKGRHIITTAIEHPAIINPCLFLLSQGYDVTFLRVDSKGHVDPAAVKEAIRPNTILISIMHANNETGTIEPIAEIGAIAREAGILFHTDAAQSAGKIRVRVSELNVDFLSIAGHKMYAPKGIGALFIKDGIKIEPFMHGGGQESGRRAGTENVMLSVALGRACILARDRMASDGERMRELRDRLHGLLASRIPDLVLNGHSKMRLPNTLNVSLPGVDGSALLDAVPGVCASTGAACHDRSVVLSHVLSAMQVPEKIGRSAVRFSIGRSNTEEEIDTAARMIVDAYRRLRS
ncbi:MAG: cysteine desulfurase [Deltaproteobacteria bacterium]|nr:cysteine desulfurase [Deltaproteobacteria bacterium]RLB91008.1 MAG: cysteine desulfurase NifS [Deltaproteobacteria bacterium]RLB96038.1 MAG: cysteine desulfurase NifS [Deltaproteobacteria bacterium]